MHGRTAILMLAVVGGLAGGVYWQLQREEANAITGDRELVPGIEEGRVVRLRVDNLERSVQVTLERDDVGRWALVDPIAYPASTPLIGQLLERVITQRAYPVSDPDLAQLSLDPPRAVLEIEQDVGGERVRNRIEIGAADLDGQHAFVRVDGTVLRTLRSLDAVLDSDLPAWRSNSLFQGISPYSVVELHRRGAIALEPGAEPYDLTLDLIDNGGWRATAPERALIDPVAASLIVTNLVYARTTAFSDDAPGDLKYYGLDPAPVAFSFTTADARTLSLRLAPHANGGAWWCAVDGVPHIYRIDEEVVLMLLTPLDALVTRDVVRVARDRITAVRLSGEGREVLLEAGPRGWFVSGVSDAGEVLEQAHADRGLVEDLLGEIERQRVLALLPGVELPEQRKQGLWIETDGITLGGSIGPLHTTPDGGTGALFQRDGDGLVTLVDERLLEIVRTDPAALRSKALVGVDETDVARIELTTSAGERVYVRTSKGRWSRQGTEVEARAFVPTVDRLLGLAAEQYLPSTEGFGPVAPIRVVIKRTAGSEVAYTLDGTTGEAGLFVSAEAAALVDGALWRELSDLLQPE